MSLSRFALRRGILFGVLAALVVTISPPAMAVAPTAQFHVSGASGPAGSVVVASVVDACPPTPVGKQQVVEITFTDAVGATSLMGEVQINQDGSWASQLSLYVPYHQMLSLGPVQWDEDAAAGIGEFVGQCLVDPSGSRVVTQEYVPVPFTVTGRSLRFSPSHQTVKPGDSVRISPIDPCPSTTTSGIIFIQNYISDYTYVLLPLAPGSGSWTPVDVTIPATFANGPHKVGVICDQTPDVLTYYGEVLLNVERLGVYVSLGDSFSSGDGAGDYIAGSGPCRQSNFAYSKVLAGHLIPGPEIPSSLVFEACSGAKIADVAEEQLPAFDAIDGSAVGLVTITIGGNDIDFTQIILRCLVNEATCRAQTSAAFRRIAALPKPLVDLYKSIRNNAPNARILVLGYPDMFPSRPSTDCSGLSAGSQRWVNTMESLLNAVIQLAALRANVEFVKTSGSFAGHDICSSDPYVNGFPPLILDRTPFHPNGPGQVKLAIDIARYLETHP